MAKVVWSFIDRMNDISPPEDSAERILNEFVSKVHPIIDYALTHIKKKRNAKT